jgi:energy-coupling factor transport system permease protein
MLELLCYEEKDALLQNTHPLVMLLFLTVLFLQALLFTHPLYLLGVFSASILTALVSDAYRKCEPYLRMGLWVAGLLIAINALFVRSGLTVIWRGPDLPLLGRLEIYLEAVCYGVALGVRLLIVLLVFALYNALAHPDKIMNLCSRLAFKSALVLSLSTRMLPMVARDLTNVVEAQQMRGCDSAPAG